MQIIETLVMEVLELKHKLVVWPPLEFYKKPVHVHFRNYILLGLANKPYPKTLGATLFPTETCYPKESTVLCLSDVLATIYQESCLEIKAL